MGVDGFRISDLRLQIASAFLRLASLAGGLNRQRGIAGLLDDGVLAEWHNL